MVNNAQMKAELSLLEDTILQMLSASQGNILDDENLINTLAVSKVGLLVSVPVKTDGINCHHRLGSYTMAAYRGSCHGLQQRILLFNLLFFTPCTLAARRRSNMYNSA